MLDKALQSGINLFDTAPSYSKWKGQRLGSEEQFGTIPQEYRDQITLMTKLESRDPNKVKEEALIEKRTVVWFNNLIIGRVEFVEPLILESLQVIEASYKKNSTVLEVVIDNHSDAKYCLEKLSEYTLHNYANLIKVPPYKQTVLQVKTLESKEEIDLTFRVLNAVIAPKTNPDITLKVKVN